MEFDINTWVGLFTVWGMRLLVALAILVAGWVIGRWARQNIQKMDRLDGMLKSFLGGLAQYSILAVAVVTVLGQFGVQTASLIAVLGAAGLAVGLALQGTLSNVASGVMLLILRPFNVGDYIQFGAIGGTVKSLSLFGTELATADNVFIYAPNSSIWNSEIFNYSRNQQRRLDIQVGISYDDDINKAFKALEKALGKEKRLVRTEGKTPQVMVSQMGESSIDLIVRVWTKTSEYWDVKWDLTKAVKEVLDREGITIPFPTRYVINAPGQAGKAQEKKAA